MLRAVQYSVREAAASLWRGRRSAAFAILTIAAGVFVLGSFLVLDVNMRPLIARWSEAAELSIYLRDDVSPEQLQAVRAEIERAGLAAASRYVSKAEAAVRFRQDFPDLARTADQLGANPLPASFEVRLNVAAPAAGSGPEELAAVLSSTPGVADVRYDRRFLEHLTLALRALGAVGIGIAALLAMAAGLTVANVVRLAAHSLRTEIEIMQLVGAPMAFVRGPFVAQGVLQGGGGAVLALLVLWAMVALGRVRFGEIAREAFGVTEIFFLPIHLSLLLILGGMLLGCAAGLIAARGVR